MVRGNIILSQVGTALDMWFCALCTLVHVTPQNNLCVQSHASPLQQEDTQRFLVYKGQSITACFVGAFTCTLHNRQHIAHAVQPIASGSSSTPSIQAKPQVDQDKSYDQVPPLSLSLHRYTRDGLRLPAPAPFRLPIYGLLDKNHHYR